MWDFLVRSYTIYNVQYQKRNFQKAKILAKMIMSYLSVIMSPLELFTLSSCHLSMIFPSELGQMLSTKSLKEIFEV